MIDLIDIHAHILPGIDDGAATVEISLEMLKESKRQGVKKIVATSHCYAKTDKDVVEFINKRRNRYEQLMQAVNSLDDDLPQIYLGCELHLENNISKFDRLEELCIDGTEYLLLEMPYREWNDDMYDEIYGITLRKIKPVMAHIERFYNYEKKFENLIDMDLLYQINADSFIKPGIKKIIPYFFKNRMAQFIGSDMHNITSRPTNIKAAYLKIKELYGKECMEYLNENAEKLLSNAEIIPKSFKKKNIFTRLHKNNK